MKNAVRFRRSVAMLNVLRVAAKFNFDGRSPRVTFHGDSYADPVAKLPYPTLAHDRGDVVKHVFRAYKRRLGVSNGC